VTNRGELFRVTVSAGESGEIRLAVQGELDSSAAQELAAAFSEAVKREKLEQSGPERAPARITLDLEGVDFIDSGGLRMLIAIQREADGEGIELIVLSPPDSVTQLLHLAGAAERMNLVRGGEVAEPEAADFLERVELEFEADDRAPSRARAAVRESLAPVLSDSALAHIVLMTSELVTNGVVHSTGGRNVGLRVTTFPDSVRVEVDDPGVGFDPSWVPSEVPAPEVGGRGLFVVDRCSSRWGTRRADTDRGRRFSVWFELDKEAT
jgi:anti-anti-sigma factor